MRSPPEPSFVHSTNGDRRALSRESYFPLVTLLAAESGVKQIGKRWADKRMPVKKSSLKESVTKPPVAANALRRTTKELLREVGNLGIRDFHKSNRIAIYLVSIKTYFFQPEASCLAADASMSVVKGRILRLAEDTHELLSENLMKNLRRSSSNF